MPPEALAAAGAGAHSRVSARQLLVDWANTNDGWVREIALAVLSTTKPIAARQIADIFARFLSEKRLSDEVLPAVPALEYQEGLGDSLGALAFRKLSDVRGVNALAGGQEILFNPALTILFGENGTGKTGYARILKGLAAVRTAEQILPDVHGTGPQPDPHALLEYSLGEETLQLEWSGETGVAPLTRACVFDSPAVRFHVDEDLSFVYTPRDLALFSAVSEGVGAVKAAAEEAVGARRPGSNSYLAHFERGTAVYTQLETLGPATELGTLEELAAVSDGERENAGRLRTAAAAMQSGSLQSQLAVARSRLQLYDELSAAAVSVAAFDAEAYNDAVAVAARATDAYSRLRADLLSDAGIDDGSQEAWQEFVLKGEAYRAQLAQDEQDQRPAEGDPCLYCRQPLDKRAAALLARYHDFATDVTRTQVADAQGRARALLGHVAAIDRPALIATVRRHLEDDPGEQLLLDAESLLLALEDQSGAWQTLEALDWSKLGSPATALQPDLAIRRSSAQQLLSDLTARSSDLAGELERDSRELRELTARIELASRIEDVRGTVRQAKWVQRLEQLIHGLSALLRSLTEVSKTASRQLLNDDFEAHFAQECSALRAPTLRLEFPGRRGQPARRKVVSAEYRPSQVLSEGEQKVIALADFLAESELQLAPAPVIFDDPVNSLDYRRIGEVADRIARLARGRQTIVFTHSIWLATELLARFEKTPEDCSYYSVSDEGGMGIVTSGTGPRWDTVKSMTKTVNEVIAAAKATDGEARTALVENGYSRIRSWCEVVVESDLLRGVTKRHQANVMMTLLPQIRGDRLAATTEAIVPVFERACRVMEGHSQPLETLSVRPTLEELEADWATLKDARSAYLAD